MNREQQQEWLEQGYDDLSEALTSALKIPSTSRTITTLKDVRRLAWAICEHVDADIAWKTVCRAANDVYENLS